ncbi:hypothetical protein GCM10010387_24400 [Streptomyces inusitatus]|uniref:Sortase n=1 Tax=Streptomyces inusitatus TaxID=68221 RepID=A0A918Q1J3_9ACTN|nr:class E sortase [Streptomyces inusitatus]GGZ30039.1 hypothetical protein GCM10010387_24400 [Streptomyces inusitatus]
MAAPRALPLALASALLALIAGCGTVADARPAEAAATSARAVTPTPTPSSSASSSSSPERRESEARTLTAKLSIPAIGLHDLPVVPYEGTTDDTEGTRIQNRGDAASPYGEHGGVGPGEKGNYLVTAHRLTAGGPLRDLPELRAGDTVTVTAGGRSHTYEITETRQTSFRSARSLAEQRAPVPGHPGERPTQAMITISTCATPEDDAAGNFWRDEHGNPEHRIDKIGVLREPGTP